MTTHHFLRKMSVEVLTVVRRVPMKSNRSINWISIALGSLALTFVVIFLMLPLLAKGITQIVGNPIEPEKLDIRPIPVPVLPEQLAISEPAASGISSAPSLIADVPVPKAAPVPTPAISAELTASSFAQHSMPESAIALKIPIINQQGVIVMVIALLVLLIWVGLHRIPIVRSLDRKSA